MGGLLVGLVVAGVLGWALGGDQEPVPADEQAVEIPGPTAPPPPPPAPGVPSLVARPDTRWTVDLDAPASRVAIVGRRVVAVVDTTLRGYDLSTGAESWELELPGPVRAFETVADRVLVALGRHGSLAVDAASGAAVWRSEHAASVLVPAGGTVVTSDGSGARGLDLADGATRWVQRGPATVASGRAGDVVTVATPTALLGLDRATGETRWRREAGAAPGRPDQSPDAAVVVDGDRLLLLDTTTGDVAAALRIATVLGDRVRGSPRITGDGGVLVSLGDALVGLDAELEASWRADWDVPTALLDHDDPAVVVLGGINVRGLDPATGVEVLRVTPSGWFTDIDIRGERMALAVHTPTRGRLVLAELVESRLRGPQAPNG